MKVMVISIVIPEGLVKWLEDLEIRRQVETIQISAILNFCKNTEKSPGDLKRLAVTQNIVKNYLQTLVWKTLKWVKL